MKDVLVLDHQFYNLESLFKALSRWTVLRLNAGSLNHFGLEALTAGRIVLTGDAKKFQAVISEFDLRIIIADAKHPPADLVKLVDRILINEPQKFLSEAWVINITLEGDFSMRDAEPWL
jgi:hypothetical protein